MLSKPRAEVVSNRSRFGRCVRAHPRRNRDGIETFRWRFARAPSLRCPQVNGRTPRALESASADQTATHRWRLGGERDL